MKKILLGLSLFFTFAVSAQRVTPDDNTQMTKGEAKTVLPVLLSSATIASVAQYDIVMTSYWNLYNTIQIKIIGLVPATDGAVVYIRLSTNGGSTYDASSGNYHYTFNYSVEDATGANAGSASATEIAISGTGTGVDNAAGSSFNSTVEIYMPSSTALKPMIGYLSRWHNSAGAGFQLSGMGFRTTAQDTDAVRIIMSSGNITSAIVEVWGYK